MWRIVFIVLGIVLTIINGVLWLTTDDPNNGILFVLWAWLTGSYFDWYEDWKYGPVVRSKKKTL